MEVVSGSFGAGLLATIAALMSLVTVSKARLWQDPVLFWTDIVDGLPPPAENVEKLIAAHALDSLGVALHRQGKNAEAVPTFRRGLEISPVYIPVVCDTWRLLTPGWATPRSGSFSEKGR